MIQDIVGFRTANQREAKSIYIHILTDSGDKFCQDGYIINQANLNSSPVFFSEPKKHLAL